MAPEVVDIFTVHTFVIDGTFEDDASIIGGLQTIDGLVLLAYQVDTESGDHEYGEAALDINEKDCTAGGVMTDDGDVVGLYASKNSGTWSLGLVDAIHDEVVEVPHISFNVKNRAGSSKLFHCTIKVVVLNRQGS